MGLFKVNNLQSKVLPLHPTPLLHKLYKGQSWTLKTLAPSFLSFFARVSSIATFSHRKSVWIKNYLAKVDMSTQNPKGIHLSITPSAIFGPPFGFCRRWRNAPNAARLVLSWLIFKSRVSELPKIIDLFQRIIFSLRAYWLPVHRLSGLQNWNS